MRRGEAAFFDDRVGCCEIEGKGSGGLRIMQRVQWVDPSDDPNSAAANSVGKELELRSAVSGLRLFVFV